MSPIAGEGPANCSIVRLHAPLELIKVYWTAISEGKPPVLPSHKSYLANGNRVFLGGERVGIVTPALVGHYWSAAGYFLFAVVSPEGLSSDFSLARCPWEGTDASDFYIPSTHFQKGIINDNWLQPIGVAPDPDVQLLGLQIAIRN